MRSQKLVFADAPAVSGAGDWQAGHRCVGGPDCSSLSSWHGVPQWASCLHRKQCKRQPAIETEGSLFIHATGGVLSSSQSHPYAPWFDVV